MKMTSRAYRGVVVAVALLLMVLPLLGACGKEVVKEVVKEVPVQQQVIKEVPVEKIVVKEVPKEVVKEVPVERVVEKEVIKEVPVEKVVIKEVPVEKKPAPTPVSTRKPEFIEIRTAGFGGSAYIGGFAFADVLNKKHPWLRASALETFGSTENLKTTGLDPAKKKRTVLNMGQNTFWEAQHAVPPFNEKTELFTDVKIVDTFVWMANGFITLDPNIKTLKDLAGKRVSTYPVGQTKWTNSHHWTAAAGVFDSIQWSYGSWAEGCSRMVDGKVDATLSSFTYLGENQWEAMPGLVETLAKRKVYLVGFEEDTMQRILDEFGEPWGLPIVVKKDSISPGFPDRDVLQSNIIICWAAFPDLSEEIVYEFIKAIDENTDMLPGYHPMLQPTIPANYGVFPATADQWHPGAKKYYDEKGIRYGVDYFNERMK